ncbi:hypothetical protein [Desulfomonile tiedjei]|uniref:Uncharacterized protein n=1 Tax=Desulfomonile tiedjei (strain ATCC 49306 / DSM 6799 / DCB-1) TaxID=706587 RepID=I4CBX7_DESTA|nr:hypothetical protein [Desulfomonile tiedjei]AFM27068.1 hypothetical protein Desti_4436 [Desulfomonile tiedjei DSM 6799]
MSIEIGHGDQLAPRLPHEIMEELRDLKKIEDVLAEQTEDTASHRFRLRSVNKMRLALQEELHAAQLLGSDNDFELSLEGEPVQDHMIAANFLGRFLADLQELADRVTFAAGATSRISEELPESSLLDSRIMITGWRASSFTVQFKLVPQRQTDDLLVSERHKIALRDLRGLFDDATPDEELTDLITRSASRTAYRRLLRNVANGGATVKLRTKVDPYPTRLSAEKAAERTRWMDVAEKETKQILRVAGILVAGNIDAHTFRIRTKEITYWGPIAPDAQQQIQQIALGSNVNAMIKQITKYKSKVDHKPSVNWTLETISEAPKESSEETINLFE